MANEAQRNAAMEAIRRNIDGAGYHLYVVSGAATPRFAYTIGMSESLGFELIMAGAVFYDLKQVVQIIKQITEQLKSQPDRKVFEFPAYGSFALKEVDPSWSTAMMLGAFDYYKKADVAARQIVPDETHRTVDVPDMNTRWNVQSDPAWRWMYEQWPYPVPEESTVTTNLAALRGDRITEVMRWEVDDWEIFAGAGPDVPKDELRVVPLGVLLAADPTLTPIVSLPIGGGLWRDAASDWHVWATKVSDAE